MSRNLNCLKKIEKKIYITNNNSSELKKSTTKQPSYWVISRCTQFQIQKLQVMFPFSICLFLLSISAFFLPFNISVFFSFFLSVFQSFCPLFFLSFLKTCPGFARCQKCCEILSEKTNNIKLNKIIIFTKVHKVKVTYRTKFLNN